MANKILVVDDDEASCRLMAATFRVEGFEVVVAHRGSTGLERVVVEKPDVILLDIHLPDVDGLQVLQQLKSAHAGLPVIMLTASTDIKTAVRATQMGAFDYLVKPIDPEEVVICVKRAVETRDLHREVEDLRRRVNRGEADSLAQLMGSSAAVSDIARQVEIVAASNFTVLILGETGTGKELVAQAIHRQSDRRRRPFIALDCGAIPELLLESELFGHEKGAFTGADRRKVGRFELAAGGTCFLDEIGNLPVSLQAKLLRTLESRQVQALGSGHPTSVDVRFVAATNDDLQARAQGGAFRSDLYFRLAQYTIVLPPLRSRPDDIEYLAERFIEEARIELRRPMKQLGADAVELLRGYGWPGNVRELRNVVRQAVLQSTDPEITASNVRPFLAGTRAAQHRATDKATSLRHIAGDAAGAAERQAILDTLKATGGNKSKAARLLQTDYKTLHLKLKRLGINARDFMS